MKFLCARQALSLSFFGATYALEPVDWTAANPDHILAAPDALALSLARLYPQNLQLVDFDAEQLPGFPRRLDVHPAELPAQTRILMLRDAGLGDALTMTPLVAHLNSLGSKPRIRLATLQDRHALLAHLDCELLPLPLPLAAILDQADYFVDFNDPQGICEAVEMIDFNLASLNIEPAGIAAELKRPSLNPALGDDEVTQKLIHKLAGSRSPRILCAPGASDRLRTLPLEMLRPIFEHWPQAAFLVTGEVTAGLPANVFALDTQSSLSAFTSAIAGCDALIAADSAAYHIAAALQKPALAIFGPVPSKIRSGYYPNVISLDAEYSGAVCCSPCFIHGHLDRRARIGLGLTQGCELQPGDKFVTGSGQRFVYDPALGCPEMQARHSAVSPCLASIPAERLLAAFAQVLALIASPTWEQT